MSSVRPVLLACALVASVGSCKGKSSSALAPGGADGAAAADTTQTDAIAGAPPSPAEKIQIVASFEGVEDMMLAVKDVSGRVSAAGEVDPLADLQANFLQLGFAPGFMGNIDLDGLHAFAFELPDDEGATPADFGLAGSIAVIDARKVIEASPAAFRPQPVGDGVWEFKQDDQQLLLKEAGKELQLGLSTADLDRAAGLRKEVGKGRRVRARAWNIPTDNLDPAGLLGLPTDIPLVKHLSTVVKELKSVELELDLGMKRDLELMASAEAPFSELGIEPLGKPRATGTAIERALPSDPFFVTTMSWGDPSMVHKMIDKQVPTDVAGTFGEVIRKAVGSAHALLDQVANDVVLAVYVDKKGRASFVLAADVKDGAKTKTALRTVHESLKTAADAHAVMQGKNDNAKFKVDYKPDGLKLKGAKADRLTVTIPKDFRSDVQEGALFIAKNKVDVISLAEDNVAMLVIGAGAKGLVSNVASSLGKGRKDSLATDVSLGKVREVMGGCQICVTADAPDYLAFRLRLIARNATDKGVSKDAKAALSKLGKVGELGDPAFGVRVLAGEATVAAVLPESALFASKQHMSTLADVNRFVMLPEEGLAWTELGAAKKPAKKAEKKAKAPKKK